MKKPRKTPLSGRTAKQRANQRVFAQQQFRQRTRQPTVKDVTATTSWWLAPDFYSQAKQEAKRMTAITHTYERKDLA